MRHIGRTSCKKVKCLICNLEIPFLEYESHKAVHVPIRIDPPTSSQTNIVPQITLPEFQNDENYPHIYTTFKKYIEPSIKTGPHTTTYNFQIVDFSTDSIANCAKQILSCQVNACKVSVSFGYILRNTETGDLAFYWASRNNQLLFDQPKLVNCQLDIDNFIESILRIDLKSHVVYPNSKFSFIKSTNVTFYLTHLHGSPIGTGKVLPKFLMGNQGLYTLIKSNNSGKPYKDNLCFFRCLALHNGASLRAVEKPTKELLTRYCNHIGIDKKNFSGITLSDLEVASTLFDTGINVYEQCEKRLSKLLFRSLKQETIMYLNLYDDHFSYIKSLDLYSSSFCCPKCRKIFPKHWSLKRHFATCDAATTQVYQSGVYRVSDTIFDSLERHNISIPRELQYHEYRICFDIECFMNRDTSIQDTERVSYEFKHEVASVSVCSNVPDFTEPRCFVSDGCPKKLVKNMLSYMQEISEEASQLQREKFSDFIPQIDALDDSKLQNKFDDYMDQIPVLSFNGSRYDLKVIKGQLISALLDTDEMRYVIKRGSSYSCIATEHFKFLDVTSYLAAGVSYDGFLKAYNSTVTKGYFPYEYFYGLGKLNSTEFPAYEHFFSCVGHHF